MLKPIAKNFKGLITITGPTNSGKSKLAEYLIKEQQSIIYIATSKPRNNDPEWQQRINVHRSRRPNIWKLIEHPLDICSEIESVGENESILLDSLGGLVEQHLMKNNAQWELFQSKFLNCLKENNLAILIVAEEVGWGVVPATKIGNLFRERLTNLSSLISSNSSKRWLALNGTAIELEKIGFPIP